MPDHSPTSNPAQFSSSFDKSTYARYPFAVAVVLLALAVRYALTPLWGPTELPFIFFYPAIVLAAWYGRRGPALFAIALSTLAANWFFFVPVYSLNFERPSGLIAIVSFVLVSVFLVEVIERMHRSNDQVARAQQDQARLAEIVKYSGDAIVTKDFNGIINSWNESAKRLFGYETAEIIGKPATVLFPPDRLQEEDDILGRLRQGLPSERLETIRLRKDGKPIHVSVSVSPLRNSDDQVVGASKIIRDVTELVTAREELTREKELLATTLASIGDAVILTDEQGRITFLNSEAERLTAWTNEEACGRSLNEVFTIINEQTRETVENPVEKVMRLGGVVGLANHTVLLTKDSREIPIDDSAAPIRKPGGPIFGIVLVFRDFSKRKQAEQTVRESEALLSAVLQQLPVGVGVMDQNGRWIVSNAIMDQWAPVAIPSMLPERTSRWRGYDPAGRLIPVEKWPGQRALRGETTSGIEMIFSGDDERDRWMRVSSAPLRDDADRIIGATAVVQDVTNHKLIEKALIKKEAELEAIIDSTPFMLTRCTRDLRYRFVSRAYARMLGREPRDIAGKSLREVMGEDGFNTILPYVERVLNGEQVEYEAEVSFAGVSAPYLHVIYTPDRDQQGNVIGWIASIRDVTERKLAEAERERLLKTEHELRQVAEEANRLKDEFLAIMSHELRNPLNVILGYSELLVRSDAIADSSQLHRMVEAIKRNALAQSKLIRDLLDLSRLRSGKLELNRETVSLMVSVNEAIDTVRTDAEVKQIAIEVLAHDKALFVEGDPVRLEQIIWNLLNNSVKFTPPGGKITVHATKNGEQIALSVEDTGQGIDPTFLPHVFEMFRQADGGTNRAQSGLGIGLAVVQQLVELHQGSISASSEGPGKGAKFTIRLPLSSEPQGQPTSVPDLSSTLDHLTILVVDDSEDTTQVLKELLKMSGASVVATTTGDDALRVLAGKHFDVVLSDISMPGMDGFEFLRRLRQLPGRIDMPVLAITGFGRPEDIERAQAAGFYSHVTKPFELEALVNALKKLPRRGNGGSESSLN